MAWITVNEDITSTAIFHRNIEPYPCRDSDKGYNPLSYMYLAPTQSGSIVGATYGYTRLGGTKSHNGIDFAAEVGTPVYAMYDGTIGKVYRGSRTDIKKVKSGFTPTVTKETRIMPVTEYTLHRA